MPIYTSTTSASTLTAGSKAQLAAEIATIHESINHVPSTYANVVFHELPAEQRLHRQHTGQSGARQRLGTPRPPRRRHHGLAAEIATAGVDAERVLVVMQSSPARFAVEGGCVVPEPGEE